MAPGAAYRERRGSAEIRSAWGEALCEGYARQDLVLLERALGVVVARTADTFDHPLCATRRRATIAAARWLSVGARPGSCGRTRSTGRR
jgi:hypothetical protein